MYPLDQGKGPHFCQYKQKLCTSVFHRLSFASVYFLISIWSECNNEKLPVASSNGEIFLAATKQFYEWSFLSIHASVHLSVTSFSLYSCHCIIVKFAGVITMDERQGWRSKNKVTDIKVNFDPIWAFLDHNSSSNSQMATDWCMSLEVA